MWGQRQAVMGPRTLSEAGESRGWGGGWGIWSTGERPLLFSVPPAFLHHRRRGRRHRGSGWEGESLVVSGTGRCNGLLFHFWTQAGPKTEQIPTVPEKLSTPTPAGRTRCRLHGELATLRCRPWWLRKVCSVLLPRRRGPVGHTAGCGRGEAGPVPPQEEAAVRGRAARGQRIGAEEPGQGRPLAQASA